MRTFIYGIGDVDDLRRRYHTAVDATAIVEALDQADRLLHRRPAWKRLTNSPWRSLLRGYLPQTTAMSGDVILIPDVQTLGPFWRYGGKSLRTALRRELIIQILDVDGQPFDIPSPMTPAALKQLERLARAAVADFHRRRIREGQATARAKGKLCHRAPFDWPTVDGRLVPNERDLETMHDICRQVDELGWPMTVIAAELIARGATLASGRPWSYELVRKAWRYCVARGWAQRRRRPWDLTKRRVAVRG